MSVKPDPQKAPILATLGRVLPAAIVLAVVAAGAAVLIARSGMWSSGTAMVEVRVPALSGLAQAGARAFAQNCAVCHGENAAGGPGGPPLVHPIYNPGHHGDMSFVAAVQRGVRQHHWGFGNMPSQPQITRDQIVAIIRYVRELQVANGIKMQPHRM